tara:strand:- start:326 stop:541 length:216 start_codon:yes stop_codon:yes gene_type:complete
MINKGGCMTGRKNEPKGGCKKGKTNSRVRVANRAKATENWRLLKRNIKGQFVKKSAAKSRRPRRAVTPIMY